MKGCVGGAVINQSITVISSTAEYELGILSSWLSIAPVGENH